eukprot:1502924-Pleurochrysis_carterae.AAC.3
MADRVTCRTQNVEAFSKDQTARVRSPEARAWHALDSKSEAARAKAEDGHRDERMRDAAASLRTGSVGGMTCTGDTPTARDVWCLWARIELDGRPHQRASPCDRCACGLRGRYTAGIAHESKYNAAKKCGYVPWSSSCIAPTAMAAQRAATLSRIESAMQLCMRPDRDADCCEGESEQEDLGGVAVALSEPGGVASLECAKTPLRTDKSGHLSLERCELRPFKLTPFQLDPLQLANHCTVSPTESERVRKRQASVAMAATLDQTVRRMVRSLQCMGHAGDRGGGAVALRRSARA